MPLPPPNPQERENLRKFLLLSEYDGGEKNDKVETQPISTNWCRGFLRNHSREPDVIPLIPIITFPLAFTAEFIDTDSSTLFLSKTTGLSRSTYMESYRVRIERYYPGRLSSNGVISGPRISYYDGGFYPQSTLVGMAVSRTSPVRYYVRNYDNGQTYNYTIESYNSGPGSNDLDSYHYTLGNIAGFAVDRNTPYPNMYFTDSTNQLVKKVTKEGVFSTIGSVDSPSAIASDATGHNIYVASGGTSLYRFKLNAQNTYDRTVVTGVSNPRCITVYKDGDVFVGCVNPNNYTQINIYGGTATSGSNGPQFPPVSITTDDSNIIYISQPAGNLIDTYSIGPHIYNNKLVVYTCSNPTFVATNYAIGGYTMFFAFTNNGTGKVATIRGDTLDFTGYLDNMGTIVGLAISPTGTVYVATPTTIKGFHPRSGDLIRTLILPSSNGTFIAGDVLAIAIASNGDIVVSDTNKNMYRLTENSVLVGSIKTYSSVITSIVISHISSNTGYLITDGFLVSFNPDTNFFYKAKREYYNLKTLALDNSDNLFGTFTDNNTIQKIDNSDSNLEFRTLTQQLQPGVGSTLAVDSLPAGVAISVIGGLLVTESSGNVTRFIYA